ncbi:MAG: tetratricopeptide repeat protein [Pyrinomonadaceae bacterium]
MFRKSFLSFIFAATVIFLAQSAAYSQLAPVNGTVVLEKDGAKTPVAGALIEVYRTDIKGNFPSAKTNKKGEFNFAGMPYGARYVFSISAPGCSPIVYPDIKAGLEKLVITVQPGDGRKFTEAEARQAVANAPKGESDSGGLTDEQKKEQAEFEKKNADITSKNERTKAADAVAAKAFEEGKAASKAENYDLAIAKFNEGIAAVPDFVGSTPILVSLKMDALKTKGFKLYKEGATSGDSAVKKAKFEEANKIYDEALADFTVGLEVIKRAPAATDPAEQKRRDSLKHSLYVVATEVHRLKVIGGVDQSKTAEASAVIGEYLALETDPAAKLTAQMTLGDIMRRTGDFEKAVAAYREVLVMKPDHAEAMGWLGLSLFGQAVAMSPENKEMSQEGLNYMQKYVDMAPVSDTDSPAVKELKVSIKDAVVYLKAQNMAPQKTAPQKSPAGGKKK